MPSSSHAIPLSTSNPAARKTHLVVGSSGRVFAEALQTAGRQVDVIDLFGDEDTRAAASTWTPLPILESGQIDAPALIALVERWIKTHPDGALIPVTGFEAEWALVERLEGSTPWCGMNAKTLRALKEPEALATLLAGSPHAPPEIRWSPPKTGPWLRKTVGQSGGVPGYGRPYWQRFSSGETFSGLFLARGKEIRALSFQELYKAPCHRYAQRFGGCILTQHLPEAVHEALLSVAQHLIARAPLNGLLGIDLVSDGKTVEVLEINPRPTASLALFPAKLRAQLALMHIDSFLSPNKKEFPDLGHFPGDLKPGFGIVYAGASLSIPADFQFPLNCHDRPTCPAEIPEGAPLCSVEISDGGLGKLRRAIGDLRECLTPVAGQVLLESL